ncbi:hypothetical protein [uncultured Planococcus sp.]|uniref:beta barrel domain-containing protein n=1 Tax=uncultured Planococcus sp. TaxID=337815 RepID=UPI0026292D22|nr:hypothetical protein [uncultured Planococcus sp.]
MAMRELSKKDFEVGQSVALRLQGNRARHAEKGEMSYVLGTVQKVGRKYITVDGIQFDTSSGYDKSDYSANYQLFENEELLLEILEKEQLYDKLRTTFGSYSSGSGVSFTVDQLRKACEILNI